MKKYWTASLSLSEMEGLQIGVKHQIRRLEIKVLEMVQLLAVTR